MRTKKPKTVVETVVTVKPEPNQYLVALIKDGRSSFGVNTSTHYFLPCTNPSKVMYFKNDVFDVIQIEENGYIVSIDTCVGSMFIHKDHCEIVNKDNIIEVPTDFDEKLCAKLQSRYKSVYKRDQLPSFNTLQMAFHPELDLKTSKGLKEALVILKGVEIIGERRALNSKPVDNSKIDKVINSRLNNNLVKDRLEHTDIKFEFYGLVEDMWDKVMLYRHNKPLGRINYFHDSSFWYCVFEDDPETVYGVESFDDGLSRILKHYNLLFAQIMGLQA